MGRQDKGRIVGFGIYKDGDSYRLQVAGRDGKRRVMRLKSLGVLKSKRRAEDIKTAVAGLIAARDLALQPDAKVLQAIRRLSPRVIRFLDSAGLMTKDSDERTVHECLDSFLESQRGQCKDSTMLVLKRAVKHAKSYFPADQKLQSVTISDALAFSNWLKTRRGKQSPQLAEATIRKACSIISQAFRFALRSGWVRSNVFVDSGVKKSVPPNKKRVSYVSLAETEKLLSACENHEERLMVAFARYGGLRMPSEITDLRWSDFENDFKVVVVSARKTGESRSVPVMRELRQLLLESGVPQDRSEFVFGRLRLYPSLSTAMRRIIRRSGIKDYPRALHTLRGSCITDWTRRFPAIAEVASWAGHTIPVMTTYYLREQSAHSALRAAMADDASSEDGEEGGAEAVMAA